VVLHSRRRRRGLCAAALGAALAILTPDVAHADDPPFVGWSAALPAVAWQYQPNASDDCVAGRLTCVDKTIRAMQRRYDPLASACDHQAVFALAYLRTTQTYRRTSATAGFYDDPGFVNHEDAAFAALYFSAVDHWAAGEVADVPPAWRIAFGAARARTVSGIGDLLLGMNAHVNRDLPIVLAEIGVVAPDGSSRKRDHDRIDAMLNQVVEPLVAEEAARYDPGIELAPTPYGVGYTGLMQLLVAWREQAWREAEQLVSAPTPAARDVVEQAIEQDAAAKARSIVAATSYVPPLTGSSQRDRYCASSTANGG
jgi:Family of unknown function (DUF5995)